MATAGEPDRGTAAAATTSLTSLATARAIAIPAGGDAARGALSGVDAAAHADFTYLCSPGGRRHVASAYSAASQHLRRASLPSGTFSALRSAREDASKKAAAAAEHLRRQIPATLSDVLDASAHLKASTQQQIEMFLPNLGLLMPGAADAGDATAATAADDTPRPALHAGAWTPLSAASVFSLPASPRPDRALMAAASALSWLRERRDSVPTTTREHATATTVTATTTSATTSATDVSTTRRGPVTVTSVTSRRAVSTCTAELSRRHPLASAADSDATLSGASAEGSETELSVHQTATTAKVVLQDRYNRATGEHDLETCCLLETETKDYHAVFASDHERDAYWRRTHHHATHHLFWWQGGYCPVLEIEHVPRHLQDNTHILSGYRAYYSSKRSWASLFHMHNETFDIWTHVLSCLFALGLALTLWLPSTEPTLWGNLGQLGHVIAGQFQAGFDPTPYLTSLTTSSAYTYLQFADRLVLTGFLLCASMTFICSSLFHLHMCQSHNAHVFYGCLDFSGISALILGTSATISYFIFYDMPVARNSWTVVLACVNTTGIFGPLFPIWSAPHFRKLRTWSYIISGCLSSGPFLHYLILSGFHHAALPSPTQNFFMPGLILMVLFYLFGAFIYMAQFPERMKPGAFDYLGHSHTIWHIFVSIAAYSHWHALLGAAQWRTTGLGALALVAS